MDARALVSIGLVAMTVALAAAMPAGVARLTADFAARAERAWRPAPVRLVKDQARHVSVGLPPIVAAAGARR